MVERSPLPPAPALEALSEEAWQRLVDLRDGLLREVAGLEEAARGFRKVIEFLELAQEKRHAPEHEQVSAAEGLFAAMRSAGASRGSLSVNQILARLLLGMTKVSGKES